MKNRISSQAGSSLVMALVCVAVIGAVAATAMQLSAQMSSQAKSDLESKALQTFIQALETVAGTNEACLGAGGGLDGIKFQSVTGFGATNFDFAVAKDLTVGQDMSIGTQLPTAGGGRFVAQTGAIYDPLKLTIDKMSFRKAVKVTGTTQYNGELLFQAHIGSRKFAPRVIGNMSLVFSGAVPGTAASGCTFSESAQSACESMGCKFNVGAPAGKQKCVCGFPQLTCPAGQYIVGIDETVTPPQPLCGEFKADCSDPAYGGIGDGYFLAGFDDSGKPICQPVEGALASTPTPVPTATPTPTPTATPVVGNPICNKDVVSHSASEAITSHETLCTQGTQSGVNGACYYTATDWHGQFQWTCNDGGVAKSCTHHCP